MRGAAGAHGSEAAREKREGNHVGKTSRQVNWYKKSCRECRNLVEGRVGGNGANGIYGICVCIMGDQNNFQATLALFAKTCCPQTCTVLQWDFELWLASKVDRWTSQEGRNNGRDFLPWHLPCSKGWREPEPVYQQVQETGLYVTNLIYLEMQTKWDWCGFSSKYFLYLCSTTATAEGSMNQVVWNKLKNSLHCLLC